MIRWVVLAIAMLLGASGAAAQDVAPRDGMRSYPGQCPDIGHAIGQDCRFDAMLSLWRAPGTPRERVERAIVQCGRYAGIDMNYCTGALEAVVQQDLDAQVAALRKSLPEEDGEGDRSCDEECVEMLDAFHRAWLTYADARCAYGTRYNRGGTGYGATVSRCRLLSAVAHMEDLEKLFEF